VGRSTAEWDGVADPTQRTETAPIERDGPEWPQVRGLTDLGQAAGTIWVCSADLPALATPACGGFMPPFPMSWCGNRAPLRPTLKGITLEHIISPVLLPGSDRCCRFGSCGCPSPSARRERPCCCRAAEQCHDPEIPADIYEIGLVYKIDIADDRAVTVDMTLTTLVPTYCLSVVAMQAALSTLSGQRLQSSSASRRAAAQAGFLLLIQCGERPDL
jgi:hypothetical protein